MTPLEIRDGIVEFLKDNWSSTPIQWSNIEFDISEKAPDKKWIRLTVLLGASFIGELNSGTVIGVGLRYGVVIINIFTEKDSGERTGLGYASTLEELFRRSNEVDGITFDEPTTTNNGVDPNGYQNHVMSISFQTFIGE